MFARQIGRPAISDRRFALSLALITILAPSLPEDRRIALRVDILWANYKRIATDRNFMLPTLALSAVFFFLFACISGGSYLYQDIYGLTPDAFGTVFGITGAAIMGGGLCRG